jgi:nucleoside-triphosphatase THEP1
MTDPLIKHLKRTRKHDLWLHATACGSLWAALEIVLGSFLHNLRLPFAGTLLAAMSVMLLVAFDRRFGKPGLAWRAGLVCALMKSISPSAVIFGPMIGIMTEALIVDLVLRVPGPRLFVATLAGALALFSALIHKIIMLLVVYGSNLATLYKSLTQFATRETGIDALGGCHLLAVLSAIYLAIGIAAALAGRIIGRIADHTPPAEIPDTETGDTNPSPLTKTIAIPAHIRLTQTLVILAHVVIVVFCLFLLQNSNYILNITAVLSYVLLSYRFYPTVSRRILRPKIWLQFILITLLAGIFLSGLREPGGNLGNGIRAGLDMCFRALVVVTGFAALGCELRNPAVALVIHNPRLKHLHTALETAFSLLPRLTATLKTPLAILRHPLHNIAGWISTVDPLICELRKSSGEHAACWLVTGETGEGKTTKITHQIRQIQRLRLQAGGVFTRCLERWENKPSVYELVACRTGETRRLTAEENDPEVVEVGVRHHRLSRSAFAWANQQILGDLQTSDLIVIDEVGSLELRGEGFAPALHACLAAGVPCLLAVNTRRADSVRQMLGDASCQIL